jgi:hypothetical protein
MNPFAQFLQQIFQPPPPKKKKASTLSLNPFDVEPEPNPFEQFLSRILAKPVEPAPRDVTVNTPGRGPAQTGMGVARMFGELTPAEYPLAAIDFFQSAREGDKLGMGLAAASALPFVPNLSKVAPKVTKEVYDNMIQAYKKANARLLKQDIDSDEFDDTFNEVNILHDELINKLGFNHSSGNPSNISYEQWLKLQPDPNDRLFSVGSTAATRVAPRTATGFGGVFAPSPLTPNLDLSEAARFQRAKDLGFDEKVFHHTKTGEVFDAFRPRDFGSGSFHDMPGVHVGSKDAADQIARGSLFSALGKHPMEVIGESQIRNLTGPTMELRANLDNALWGDSQLFKDILPGQLDPYFKEPGPTYAKGFHSSGKPVFNEATLDMLLSRMANKVLPSDLGGEARRAALRQFLIDEGYDVLPYKNLVEDAGSISYNVLEPNNLRFRDAMFDPARRYERNLMGGLAPLPFVMNAMQPDSTKKKKK